MSKPSQDDIIADNTRLTADLTAAQGEVTRLKAENARLLALRDAQVPTAHRVVTWRDTPRPEQDEVGIATFKRVLKVP